GRARRSDAGRGRAPGFGRLRRSRRARALRAAVRARCGARRSERIGAARHRRNEQRPDRAGRGRLGNSGRRREHGRSARRADRRARVRPAGRRRAPRRRRASHRPAGPCALPRALADLRIGTSGRWLGDALELAALDLSDAASAAALSLSGRVDVEPEIAIRLRGAWRDVVWPMRGAPMLASRRGDVALSGTFDDLLAELSAELGVEGRVDGRVRRAGERFEAALEWRNLVWPQEDTRLVSEHGRLDAAGTFAA